MNNRLFATLWVALAALAIGALNFAHADDSQISSQVQQMDSSAVRDAGIQQAEEIRQIPNDLRAQGVPVSPESEARVNLTADRLAAQANEPDFKDKVVAAAKKVENGATRAGIDALEGIGYAGTSVFAVGIAPLMFGTDFLSSLVLGYGPFTDGTKNNIDELLGATGGVATFYYAYVALQLTGYVLPGTILASSMAIVVTNVLLCAAKENQGNADLDHYCELNNKILSIIAKGSAKGGDRAGSEIRSELIKAFKAIESHFRKEQPTPVVTVPSNSGSNPNPSVSPSPSPSPSLSPALGSVSSGPVNPLMN